MRDPRESLRRRHSVAAPFAHNAKGLARRSWPSPVLDGPRNCRTNSCPSARKRKLPNKLVALRQKAKNAEQTPPPPMQNHTPHVPRPTFDTQCSVIARPPTQSTAGNRNQLQRAVLAAAESECPTELAQTARIAQIAKTQHAIKPHSFIALYPCRSSPRTVRLASSNLQHLTSNIVQQNHTGASSHAHPHPRS